MQDVEGADDLFHQRWHHRQIAALRRIAEELVEDVFGLVEVGLDFLGDLGQDQFFLSGVRELVEQIHLRNTRGVEHRVDGGLQAHRLGVALALELGAEMREVVDGVLREQQGSRHFQLQGFVLAGVGGAGQALGHGLDDAGEGLQGAVGQACAALEQGQGGVLEGSQAFRAARAVAHPMVLGARQAVLQIVQMGQMRRCQVAAGLGWQITFQLEQVAYFRATATGAAVLSDVEEHVAEQALGELARAFHQAAHLQVNAAAQALEPEIAGGAIAAQQFHEAGGGPPEGILGRSGGKLFDRAHGLVHLHQSGSRFVVLQELQQAFLIQGTRFADGVGAGGVVQRQFRLGADGARLGVRVEQLARSGGLATPSQNDLLVERSELHFDVRGAAHETV